MRVLWIVGNGFDLNMRLKTGYRDFLKNAYFREGTKNRLRDELVQRLGGGKSFQGDKWSDLEILLGSAAGKYEDDQGLFHETFEDMQERFVNYIYRQQEELDEETIASCVDEFKNTICYGYERLTDADRRTLEFGDNTAGDVYIDVLNLNYTNTIDRLETALGAENGVICRRRSRPNDFNYIGQTLHVHGDVEVPEGRAVVFGVSDDSQIDSKSLAGQEDMLELWVKSRKNSLLYGNSKNDCMQSLISNAQIICLYGCSLGDSDKYIWSKVGERLVSSSSARLIYYVYGLPKRTGPRPSEFMRIRNKERNRLFNAMGIEEGGRDQLRNRIIIASTKRAFNFSDVFEREDGVVPSGNA